MPRTEPHPGVTDPKLKHPKLRVVLVWAVDNHKVTGFADAHLHVGRAQSSGCGRCYYLMLEAEGIRLTGKQCDPHLTWIGFEIKRSPSCGSKCL